MQMTQWFLLLGSVIFGAFWTFVIQNWLLLFFANVIAGAGLQFQNFLQLGSSPSFTVLWVGCLVALLIWMSITLRARPRGSAEVRRMQPLWWLASGILVVFGWISLGTFLVFKWQITGLSPTPGSSQLFFPVPPGGWLILMTFVLIDVIVVFWLPTLLATPRTYRFVVPGAVTLLGSR
jgi:hypothetical protein